MDPSLRTATDELRVIARRVMRERGLLPDFSKAVRAEADAFEGPATGDGSSIRDLRGFPWASIDNDDSRDLDQLTAAQARPDGATTVFVAVADVDALVAAGSAIDGHARINTTSVYTAAEVFSMLPEKLSTDLTSLSEDEDRLAVVVEMTVAADATIPASDLYRARVRNRAKLAYNAVCAWLEGTALTPGSWARQGFGLDGRWQSTARRSAPRSARRRTARSRPVRRGTPGRGRRGGRDRKSVV